MPKNTPMRIIDDARTRSGVIIYTGVGGAAGSGVTDHGALLGLNDDDHLQYLTASRGDVRYSQLGHSHDHTALTNVTEDQHHARRHAIVSTDHTASGLTAGHVLRASGATAFAFAQLQHGDLGGVTADQHHAQRHDVIGADHTLTGSKFQLVGAPANNTLGLVTPVSDVRSPAAAEGLLKSDSSGWLGLRSLTVDGRVDVTGTGDLYVAGSVGGAAGVMQTAGNRVGVLCVPDPQFALDVNGPARAQYFIGPHAIQLKDAIFIAHYDGPETGDTGELNGHMGQTPSAADNLIFRRGKFSKAVEVSEAVTNLLALPTYSTGFEDQVVSVTMPTGYSAYSTGANATGTRAVTDARWWEGKQSFLMTKSLPVSGGAQSDRWGVRIAPAMTTTANTVYTVSCRVYIENVANPILNTTALVQLYAQSGAGNIVTAITATTDEWVELVCHITSDALGSAMSVLVWIYNCDSGSVYVDGLQVTATGATRPYVTGSNAVSTLAYDGLPLNWGKFTAMCWFRLEDLASQRGTTYRVLEMYSGGTARVDIYQNNTNNCLVAAYISTTTANINGTTAITAGVWHHAAIVVAYPYVSLYLDGVLTTATPVQIAPSGGVIAGACKLHVGCWYSTGQRMNGMLDDVALLNRALTATEVRAVYESNAPVFAESSVWSWRATPTGLVWADERGLWMRDADGSAVLGVYGAAAAQYDWGGKKLDQGDLLLGNGTQYMKWDASASNMEFAGTVTVLGGDAAKADFSNITGDLDDIPNGPTRGALNTTLISGGNIRVGSGTKDSNLNGWHISAAEIVGQKAGADQILLNTDGELVGAERKVAITRNGFAGTQSAGALDGTKLAFYTTAARTVNTGYIESYTDTSGILPFYDANVLWLRSNTSAGKTKAYVYIDAADGALINGNAVYHTGNFAPSNYLSKVGSDTMAGVLTCNGVIVDPGEFVQVGPYERVWRPGQQIAAANQGSYGPTLTYDAYYSSGWKAIATGAPAALGVTEGFLWFANAPSTAANAAITWTNRLVVNTAGATVTGDIAATGNVSGVNLVGTGTLAVSGITTLGGGTIRLAGAMRFAPISAPAYELGYGIVYMTDGGSGVYQLRFRAKSGSVEKDVLIATI